MDEERRRDKEERGRVRGEMRRRGGTNLRGHPIRSANDTVPSFRHFSGATKVSCLK